MAELLPIGIGIACCFYCALVPVLKPITFARSKVAGVAEDFKPSMVIQPIQVGQGETILSLTPESVQRWGPNCLHNPAAVIDDRRLYNFFFGKTNNV